MNDYELTALVLFITAVGFGIGLRYIFKATKNKLNQKNVRQPLKSILLAVVSLVGAVIIFFTIFFALYFGVFAQP